MDLHEHFATAGELAATERRDYNETGWRQLLDAGVQRMYGSR